MYEDFAQRCEIIPYEQALIIKKSIDGAYFIKYNIICTGRYAVRCRLPAKISDKTS